MQLMPVFVSETNWKSFKIELQAPTKLDESSPIYLLRKHTREIVPQIPIVLLTARVNL